MLIKSPFLLSMVTKRQLAASVSSDSRYNFHF